MWGASHSGQTWGVLSGPPLNIWCKSCGHNSPGHSEVRMYALDHFEGSLLFTAINHICYENLQNILEAEEMNCHSCVPLSQELSGKQQFSNQPRAFRGTAKQCKAIVWVTLGRHPWKVVRWVLKPAKGNVILAEPWNRNCGWTNLCPPIILCCGIKHQPALIFCVELFLSSRCFIDFQTIFQFLHVRKSYFSTFFLTKRGLIIWSRPFWAQPLQRSCIRN